MLISLLRGEPGDMLVLPIGCEQLSELMVCFMQVRFHRALASFDAGGDIFDREFLSVAQQKYTLASRW